MATTYKDVDIQCPFFKELAKKGVSCEGLTDDSIIKLWFSSPKSLDLHTEIFCCNRYQNCEIYRMLEAKYED
jgi:hypothetical protein